MLYHKINSLYKRDQRGNMLFGQWSVPEFELLKDIQWVATEKIDGTNIRVEVKDDGTYEIGGRTERAQIQTNLLNTIRERFKDNPFSEVLTSGGTIFCEGCGDGIQKNGANYGDIQDIVVFDITIGDLCLERDAVENIAGRLGLPIVPIICEGTIEEIEELVLVGFPSSCPTSSRKFAAEGVVCRPAVELKDRRGRRIITKIKHKDYK